MGSAAKVAAALRLSEDDAAAINALKAEIEKAWRLVDASAEKARPRPSRGPWLGTQIAWPCPCISRLFRVPLSSPGALRTAAASEGTQRHCALHCLPARRSSM